MSFLTRIKIGPRLGAGFAIVLLLLGAVGGIGLLQASRIFDGTEEIGTNWLPSVETLGNMRNQAQDVRRTSLRMLITNDASEKAALDDQHAQMISQFGTMFDSYSKLVSSAEERRVADSIGTAWSQYLDDDKKIEALIMSADGGAPDARAAVASASAKSFTGVMDLINQDVTLNHNGSTAEVAAAKAAYRSAVARTIELILIAIGFGATIAIFITRSITGPIARAVDVAETVARGDLTARIEVVGTDEAAQLLGALRHMNERLVDLVGRVRTGSEGIATASAQIAAGNTDLSQRTEEQAASLEETAASIEELSAAVRQNTDGAKEASGLAQTALETVTRGADVVARVNATMNDITASSQKVEEITGIIEGIAFQTNILALNAAVEAARAGEQGRGFAVVASEVRSLAQRSGTAAKEIKELIAASAATVGAGARLVEDARRTMEEARSAVARVSGIMSEIETATHEQSDGIEQVNRAIAQIDEVTQRNAALVEEAAAAAQSLESQADLLREAVAVFNLGSAGQAGTRPAQAAAADARAARGSTPALA
ncbi:methyl-accepting chemotaxis protein [Paraburkholderia sp. BR14261]